MCQRVHRGWRAWCQMGYPATSVTGSVASMMAAASPHACACAFREWTDRPALWSVLPWSGTVKAVPSSTPPTATSFTAITPRWIKAKANTYSPSARSRNRPRLPTPASTAPRRSRPRRNAIPRMGPTPGSACRWKSPVTVQAPTRRRNHPHQVRWVRSPLPSFRTFQARSARGRRNGAFW